MHKGAEYCAGRSKDEFEEELDGRVDDWRAGFDGLLSGVLFGLDKS